MLKTYFYISILFLLVFTYCSDDVIEMNKVYKIEIIEPANNFVLGQGKGLVVKLRVETLTEIEKVMLYQIFPTIPDTVVRELFFEPFIDTVGTVYEISCIDSLPFNLLAIAYYHEKGAINSNIVTGIASNEIPPNNLLNTFEYKGYDWDSNLVAEGLIYIDYNSDRHFKIGGRRDINYVQGDSVYEVGNGNFVAPGLGSNNEFELDLTYCTSFFQEPKLYITGNWNDTLMLGDRYTYWIFDPPIRVYLGRFTLIKK